VVTRQSRLIPLHFAILVILLLGLAGCAGPKRLPPVQHASEGGGASVGLVAADLLTVGLAENQTSLSLSATGAAVVLGKNSSSVQARMQGPNSNLICWREDEQVVWQAGSSSGRQETIRLQVIDPDHRLTHEQGEYRGEFFIIPSPIGKGLTLINALDLESYLRGVVPWEIGRHGPEKMAALQAQAIAARTYTVSHLGARHARGFDVFATVMDQVYRGSKDEDALCNQAVSQTRGLVLVHDGEPIDAYYSACCGGVSSLIEEVWPYSAEGYLKSQEDKSGARKTPFCGDYKYFNWRESWSAADLTNTLQKTLPEYVNYMSETARSRWAGPIFTPGKTGSHPDRPGALLDLEIKGYTTSGRTALLDVTTEAGVYHVRGDRTRWVLKPLTGPPAILRSAMFEVEMIRRGGKLSEVSIRGRGYGHGLGMCQTGALARAESGQSYEDILAHYYPGSKLITPSINNRD